MPKRLFIAINVPPAVRVGLAKIIAQLPDRPGITKTRLDNHHLTLLFLGDTDEEMVPRISEALKGIGHKFAPLQLSFTRLGGFPNLDQPQTLWVGLDGDGIFALQSEITKAIIPFAPNADSKPFHPHLTLARIKNGHQINEKPLSQLIEGLPSFSVSQIDLMESTLTPRGSVYKIISSHRLAG